MYLTRIPLDLTKRKTLYALTSPSIFHGAIEASFGGGRKRNLWRLDELEHRKYLLLLSEEKPDLSSLEEQFSPEGENGIVKDYSKLLNRIEKDYVWRFRLCANPTHSVMQGGKRGKKLAYTVENEQLSWLKRQAEKNGFLIEEKYCRIVRDQWFQFNKGSEDRKVRMLLVTYEGILKVVNPELCRNALIGGIGREKAYGAGLLTLMSLENS